MMNWKPIETAPRDGTPVLVWHDHTSDPYHNEDRLTDYGCWAEHCPCEMTEGAYIAWFGGGYTEDISGEGWGPFATYPDWWFKDKGDDTEEPLAPTHWMPLPDSPKD